MNDWCWEIVATLLHKASHRSRWSRLVRFHEASVIHAHESVATGTIVEIVDAEGIGLDLSATDLMGVVALETVCERNANNTGSLNHFYFKKKLFV